VEVGSEKLRYLIGEAIVVNSKGRTICVTLEEIYEKALAAGPRRYGDAGLRLIRRTQYLVRTRR